MSRHGNAKASRNQPRQSRSRLTVDAILEATIRVLEQEGAEAATTSRVAEVAGVSVGTLYQYFANRDAILNALQDRELERASQLMSGLLGKSERASEQAIARAVVGALLKSYRAAPALHRVLAVEGLRVTPHDRVLAFDARVVGTIRAFLSLPGMRVRRKNLDAAAFVIYQAVRAAMLAYLLEDPAGLDDGSLVDELTDLILRYLVDVPAPEHVGGSRPPVDSRASHSTTR
jgi:AcrR family transcriptional regulator